MIFLGKMRFASRGDKQARDCFRRPRKHTKVQSFDIVKAGGVACLPILVAAGIAAASRAPASGRLALTVGELTLQVEVAETAAMRRRGLSGRGAEADDAAMLFVFPREERPCFWMKDTALALSLVFMDAQGVIRQQEALAPNDERYVCARQPILWALEVSAHSQAAQQLTIGQHVHGLPKPAPSDHQWLPR